VRQGGVAYLKAAEHYALENLGLAKDNLIVGEPNECGDKVIIIIDEKRRLRSWTLIFDKESKAVIREIPGE